jgi:hypothetical protein
LDSLNHYLKTRNITHEEILMRALYQQQQTHGQHKAQKKAAGGGHWREPSECGGAVVAPVREVG